MQIYFFTKATCFPHTTGMNFNAMNDSWLILVICLIWQQIIHRNFSKKKSDLFEWWTNNNFLEYLYKDWLLIYFHSQKVG